MVVPPGHAALPGVGGQLMVLPPLAKILAGVSMAAMAIAAMVMMPVSLPSLLLLGFALVVGVPLLLAGLAERRQARIDADELWRARVDRDVLVAAVTDAVRNKRGVDRMLRERGYTSAKARRWIALEADVVLPPGGD